MRPFLTIVAVGLSILGCASDAVVSNIQTTSESATVAVGTGEVVRGGGRLKLSNTADLVIPLGGVPAEVTLESTSLGVPVDDAFAPVTTVFEVAPAGLAFSRPARFSVPAPEVTERLVVVWRATSDDAWVGLPSRVVTEDTDNDGVIDSATLKAWIFETGQLAAVRYTTENGACCSAGNCSLTTEAGCSGTFFGAGSACEVGGVSVCRERCCLSAFAPGSETTSSQGNIGGCLDAGTWPLGADSTCDTQCCSVETGPGSVSRYTALCTDTSATTSCEVCCLDNGTAAYAAAGSCTTVDTTGASCQSVCCASAQLDPIQGFTRVTRFECNAASGLESFDRYCDLCADDTDCVVAPTGCQEAAGTCVNGQCTYAATGVCVNGSDCGDTSSCRTDCTCE